MRCVAYERFGPAAEVLRVVERAAPEPAEGQVRVRIVASGINPVDVKWRAGVYASAMPFPSIVPHHDGAGVIDAVGGGVDSARLGQRVWIWNGQFRRAQGTAAEWIALPDEQAVALPAGVPFEEGACLGVPALTAYRAVTSSSVDLHGSTVLVAGGAGAVGAYAVQMARLKGARVVATVGDERRRDQVRALGASEVLNHTSATLRDELMEVTQGAGFDHVVEVEWGLNQDLDVQVVRPEGSIYVFGSARRPRPEIDVQALMAKGVTLHFRSVFMLPPALRRRAVDDISGWLQAGRLAHRVGESFPLEACAEAHEAVEAGASQGRVLLAMGADR